MVVVGWCMMIMTVRAGNAPVRPKHQAQDSPHFVPSVHRFALADGE